MVGPKVIAVRWLLVCALAFGLLGMHHLAWFSDDAGAQHEMTVTRVVAAAPVAEQATAGPAGGHESPMTAHDILHLCLVILVAALALAALRVQWWRPEWRTALRCGLGPPPRGREPRAPPDSVAILTSLGVLRQ